MEKPCLFCLESLPKESLQNPIGCACQIAAHTTCLHQWFQQRQTLECPICHAVAIPNPGMHQNVHIVYVNRIQQQEEQRQMYTAQQKAAAICCFMLMGWTTGLTILQFVYG